MRFNDQVMALAEDAVTARRDKYKKSLQRLKPAGQGNGTHSALLAIANRGVRAGIAAEEIASDIRQNLPPGSRVVSDAEIWGAVNKALADGGKPPTSAVPIGPPRVRPELRDRLIAQGAGATIKDIMAASPLPIPASPVEQQRLVLVSLYGGDEFVFIGERHDTDPRTVRSWVEILAAGHPLGPHIIPNPLTGEEGLTKDNKPSRRADACVAAFRFAVVEFDGLPLEQQVAFWTAVKLPVTALIDSGGKSIHGWIRVDAPDRVAWERDIEVGLFAERLVPQGVDAACRNEARLSRMPGHTREDSGRVQRLLYLAPAGKAVRA